MRDEPPATPLEAMRRAFEDPHAMPVLPQQEGANGPPREPPTMAMSSGFMTGALR